MRWPAAKLTLLGQFLSGLGYAYLEDLFFAHLVVIAADERNPNAVLPRRKMVEDPGLRRAVLGWTVVQAILDMRLVSFGFMVGGLRVDNADAIGLDDHDRSMFSCVLTAI